MLDKICGLIARQTGKALHLPTWELFYSVEQTLDGKIITNTGEKRGKSWVRNAYNGLYAIMAWVNNSGAAFGADSLAYKDTGGTLRSYSGVKWCIQDISTGGRWRDTAAGVASGIIIGTNSAAFSFEDYNVVQVAEGMGTGQVNYGLTICSSEYASGNPTMTQWYKRYFNNNSGGDITIYEIGIECYAESFTGLICRDVLDPAVNFLDKAQLKVQYTISLTFPYS